MARKFFVGGNFKMNPITREAKIALVNMLNEAKLDPNTEVVVAPPMLYVLPLAELIRNNIQVAAQNCFFKESGAFTGEISPKMLHDAKIPYVLIGHSERRTLFHETSETAAKKTKAALEAGIKVILCIGETLEEREGGKTNEVVQSQLKPVIETLSESEWSEIVIAYEPVWAIGTGKVATSAQAQETQHDIRAYLEQSVSKSVADTTRIIYGGSVNAKNCVELSSQPDVDGFLVGGASLKPEFVDIINSKLGKS